MTCKKVACDSKTTVALLVALVAFGARKLANSLKHQVASYFCNSGVSVFHNNTQTIENIGGGSGVCSGAPPVKKWWRWWRLPIGDATSATRPTPTQQPPHTTGH